MNEGALDLQTRVVSGESGATPGVGAEEALRDPTVVLLLEVHSISLQVGDSLGRSLGDDLDGSGVGEAIGLLDRVGGVLGPAVLGVDRKSTRLNSSHVAISYAVFCLKKKKQ